MAILTPQQIKARKANVNAKIASGALTQQQGTARLGGLQKRAAETRVNTLQTRLNTPGISAGNTARYTQRIGEITKRNGMQNPLQATTPAPQPTPETTPPPAQDTLIPALPGETPQQYDPGIGDAMFPGIRAFEPQNYEGSPLYKFQRDEGMRGLARLYAARGLTNSGAELEQNSKFLQGLGAQEAQRAQGIAQTEADRLERLQQNEAMRLERMGNEQFNRQYQVASLLASQNPMQYAYGAMQSSADAALGQGRLANQYLSDRYRRVRSGGGGAAAPYPEFIPPFAAGPDYTASDQVRALTGQANTNGTIGAIQSGLGSLYGYY